jgi:glyoxylase-like metal-dependent hydrolase (beta-lactamase superfamily II)
MTEPRIQLYVLDGGRIEILDWQPYQPGAGPGVRRWLADPCYLVVHPEGTLVWDAGLSDSLAESPEGFTIPGMAVFHVDVTVQAQLAAVGHPAADIDFLALSHFHPDHVGNVGLFTGATLLVQDDDHAAAFGSAPGDHFFDPETYGMLADRKTTLLHGDHDVFGDGTVVIKRLPGHTPGSQGLLVKLPETGAVLLSGDLAHSVDNWTRRVVPTLNGDAEATLRSFERAAQVLAEEDAVLWVQHDAEQDSTLRHAPEFYA